jgi:hypothetical protein
MLSGFFSAFIAGFLLASNHLSATHYSPLSQPSISLATALLGRAFEAGGSQETFFVISWSF